MLQTGALIVMLVIMFSRLAEYHHRSEDILAGCVLGTLFAVCFTCYTGNVIWQYDAKIRKKPDFDLHDKNVYDE